MPHLIRLATEADLPQVAAVHVASWQNAFRGVVPDAVLDRMTVEGSLQRWVKHFAACPPNMAVATGDDGQIAGFCYAGPIADNGHNTPYRFRVFALHTRPELRGQGIGAALLHNAFHRAVHHEGLDAAILWTLEALHRSRRFYEREGGTLVKTAMWTVDGVSLPEVAYGWQLPCNSAGDGSPPAAP